jgi:serine/threonine protein kinase/lipopolysaccharide biosynthesis regulator YciM
LDDGKSLAGAGNQEMKKNSWKKVEKIFHATLDLPSGERQTYLQNVCAGDNKLFSEVESLIESLEKESDFLDEPVFEFGLGALYENGRKKLRGTTIGFYELQEKIGAGGMGEVYKAIDTRLNRRVALKFISELVEDDQTAKRQLVKEAQAVAALEHPNICAVHGIEQTNEHHFIVMQYIEGKTLAEIIEKEPVSVEDFKSLARQILTAVAFAHSHGIIHRDLKPGNIMLTTEGQIKVLDFGLAKVINQKQTPDGGTNNKSNFSQNGLIIGTVSYMSPEQLRGEKIDFQSDIFSVGIIFYEILSKTNPFSRKSQAETIAAILSDQPPALEKLRRDFPASLINLVEKCLQKEPETRFQSVAEILVELDKTESKNYRGITFRRRNFLVKIVFAILLLASLPLVYLYTAARTQRSIAVLPISFDNSQSDKEYLAGALTQSIIDKLSNLSDLNVKHESLITGYKGTDPRDAGKQLNVDAVFVGSIQESPEGLILNTKLIRISDGIIIDTDKAKIDVTKWIELPGNIASRIVDKVQTKLTDEDRAKLAKKDTQSETAKDLYFQGRFYLKRRKERNDVEKAIQFFLNAKDMDLNYAKPWAGLADAYLYQSTPGVEGAIPPKQAFELAKKMATRALDLDYTLCEAHNSLGLINYRYEWNWDEAERYFRAAIDCDSELLPARFGLINVLKIRERYDEAFLETEKVKELDPASVESDIQIALIYYRKGNYEQMDKILSELLKSSPNDRRVKYTRVYQFLKTGRFKEAIEILEPIYASNNEEDKIFAAAPLGFAYAKTQRRNEALKIIDNLGTFKKNYVPAQERALIYVGLGEYDKVFDFLNQSCNERFASLPGWINDPVVDEVKSDARFSAIRECVKL